MAGYGQPTKCTDEVIATVEKILPTVLYLESVADYVGVDRITVGRWIKEGKREERRRERGIAPSESYHINQCYRLWLVYKRALASGEIFDAGTIKKAAEKQWQAAAWRLERRFPEKWGGDRRVIRDLEKKLRELEEALRNTTDELPSRTRKKNQETREEGQEEAAE